MLSANSKHAIESLEKIIHDLKQEKTEVTFYNAASWFGGETEVNLIVKANKDIIRKGRHHV